MRKIELDRYDVRLLELLQENSLLPRQQLADKVGLSSSQCFRRVKRLEDTGIIERYKAVINREKVGFGVAVAIMIQYRKSEVGAREQLIELIKEVDVIQECFSITGDHDFLLRVHCESMKDFSTLLNETFQKSYISGMHSYMLTESIKDSHKLPLNS